jgi:uncharacterized protein (TIGR03435 family)
MKAALAAVATLAFWAGAIHAQDTATGDRTFDVASIKPNTSGTVGFSVQGLRNGRAILTNVTVRALLYRAFDITADTPILGLPSWVDTEHYDIEVRTGATPSAAEQRDMWRALLADRLRLRTHDETRDQPIFALVLARPEKGPGPGLTPATLSCPDRLQPPDVVAFMRKGPKLPPASTPPAPEAVGRSAMLTPELIAERLKTCGTYGGHNTMLAASLTMAALAQHLTGEAERLVIDRTGLEGAYTVRMVAPADDSASLFTILQEQLGLKLDSTRAAARVLAIDHIERPTGN